MPSVFELDLGIMKTHLHAKIGFLVQHNMNVPCYMLAAHVQNSDFNFELFSHEYCCFKLQKTVNKYKGRYPGVFFSSMSSFCCRFSRLLGLYSGW